MKKKLSLLVISFAMLQTVLAQETNLPELEEFNPDDSELFDMSEGEVINPYLSDYNQRVIKTAISDYMNGFKNIRGTLIGEKGTGVSKITGIGSGIMQYNTIAQIDGAVNSIIEDGYYTATIVENTDFENAKLHYSQLIDGVLMAVKDISGCELIGQEVKNKPGQGGYYSQKYFWIDVSDYDFYKDILIQVNFFEIPVYNNSNQNNSVYHLTFSIGKSDF